MIVSFLAAAAFAQELQHVVVVVNIEVPVRVFSAGKFVADLSIDEFEVYENGQPQKVEAVYLVKKTRVEKEEGPGLQGLSPQVESRHFVLYFEMDSYLPELEKAVDLFFIDVLAPGDSVWIVTPRQSLQLKKETVARLPREKISEQLKSLLKKDLRQLAQEMRRYSRDLQGLATLMEAGAEPDSIFHSARDIFRQVRDLKSLEEKRLAQFATLLKEKTGQKHVFLFYQKEAVLVPAAFADLAEDPEFMRRNRIDVGKIKKMYADVSTTIHCLYVTRTGLNPAGVDSRRTRTDGTIIYSPDGGGGDFYNAFRGLAVATGGLTESSANPASAFAKAVEASENYYLVYYKPSNPRPNGQFNEIEVKVKRSGCEVTHRAGYISRQVP
ncbi:MAG: hypothetical protein OEW05_05435 [Candidatus Aminicenantes bacterium]|nr:hypothetical protein [Candidatus Aminicenantes bacterium]